MKKILSINPATCINKGSFWQNVANFEYLYSNLRILVKWLDKINEL